MTVGVPTRRSGGKVLAAVAVTCLVLVAVVTGCEQAPESAGAASGAGTVSGTVWHDLDADGVRDAGEPGVRHVTIAWSGRSVRTVTGTDGRWSLSLPAGTHTITALTGWLPSMCPGDLYCKAGRTRDQDFAVENQFVRARVSVTTGTTRSGVDLGLEPDHGDPTGSPTSRHSGNDRGDGTARVHDLAVRNSIIGWYAGCTDPNRTRRCPVGTQLPSLGQVFNQGTAWVTGVRFVVTVPVGTTLVSEPKPDVDTPGPAPTRTGRTGRTADGSTWIEYHLGREVPPAAAVLFRTTLKVVSGPSSPATADAGSRVDRRSFISISQVTPTDADSPLRVDPRLGLDKGHNVNHPRRVDDDTSDAIEFNIA